MTWIRISFVVEQDRVPLIEAALENTGALAVTLGDAADEPQLEPPPGTTPLWRRVRLTALYPDQPQALATALALSRSLAAHLGVKPQLERIEDRSWERTWQDDVVPARFGRRLWIRPRGQSTDDPDAVVVTLDPGLAFGTGRHPTTALCLRWLDDAELTGKTVIDYGCGSGILAIAALRLEAIRAVAVDHDPQALEATQANAEHNGVADRLLCCPPGGDTGRAGRPPAGKYPGRSAGRARKPAGGTGSRRGTHPPCRAFFTTRAPRSQRPTPRGSDRMSPGPRTNGCW